MSEPLYNTIYIAILLVGFASTILAIHQFGQLLGQVRPEKRMLANFIAPILFFVPGLFTDKGNVHRRNLLVLLMITALSASTLLLMESSYGKPPYMSGG